MARSRVPTVNLAESPSVRSAVTSFAVPEVRSSQAGMEGLSQAFNQFFGKINSSFDNVMQAETLVAKKEIEQENHQQKLQGIADANAGVQAVSNDLDYVNAYAQASGENQGRDMFMAFQKNVMEKMGPGDDPQKALKDFLASEWGGGTGNATYDAYALSTFNRMADKSLIQFQQNAQKAVLESGREQWGSALVNKFKDGSLDASGLQQARDQYRALDPMNAHEAPLRAFQAILGGSDGSPQYTQRVLSLMGQKGIGANGGSLLEDHPGYAEEVNAKLTQKYLSTSNYQAIQDYDGIRERLSNAKTPEDLVSGLLDLNATHSRYGDYNRFVTLRDHGLQMLKKVEEEQVNIGKSVGMINGTTPLDVSVMRKYQEKTLTALGIDPVKNPIGAAGVVSKVGVLSEDLQARYANMFASTDPAQVQTAYTFYKTLEGSRQSPEFALHFMDDATKVVYNFLREREQLTPEAFSGLLADLQSTRSTLKDNRQVTWKDITGKSDGEAVAAEKIKASLAEKFAIPGPFNDESIIVDNGLMNKLADYARTHAILRQKDGMTDWQKAIAESVQATGDRLEIVPGLHGKAVVRLAENPGKDPVTGAAFVPMGPQVFNPQTRSFENTLDTFRKDMGEFAKAIPQMVPKADKVSTVKDPAKGLYMLHTETGRPLTFELGQPLDVGTGETETRVNAFALAPPVTQSPVSTKTPIPRNPEEAAAFLQGLYKNDRFVLVPFRNGQGDIVGYQLGYKPGLTGTIKTIDDREKAFKAQAPVASSMADLVTPDTFR